MGPYRQNLPRSINYISCCLTIKSKRIITCLQINILIVKKDCLKSNTFISNGIFICIFLLIINTAYRCYIPFIKNSTRMHEYQWRQRKMKFYVHLLFYIINCYRIIVRILEQFIYKDFLATSCQLSF